MANWYDIAPANGSPASSGNWFDDAPALRAAAQKEQTRRAVGSMSDQDLRAAAFEAPAPPPGVTIHGAQGDIYVNAKGKQVPATPQETQARFMREKNGVAGEVGDAVLRGVPYAGAFFPRMRAWHNSNSPEEYAKNLELEQARASTFDQDYPKTSLGSKATGAIGGTVAAMGAGRGLAALGVPLIPSAINMAFGMGASSVPGAIARGGIAGGLQGATQGVGDSTDLTNVGDVSQNALNQGALGLALGAAVPAAIAGASSGYRAVAEKMRPDALSSVPRGAREWMINELGDPAKINAIRQRMNDLGPEAMMLDASPEMAGVARGASALPGTREMVLNPLNARDAGKNARIGASINRELGPVRPPSQVTEGIRAGQESLGPAYQQSMQGARAVNTQPLANDLDAIVADLRGPAQRAVRNVRGYLNIPGTDQLDPNPRALMATRQAIDGLLTGEVNPQVIRQLTIARQRVDAELTRAVPNIKTVDANFQELALQQQGLQRGGQIFDTGKTAVRPQELAAEISDAGISRGVTAGPSAVPMRMRDGARAELDRIVGNNSNDVAKLNQVLKSEGDWNRDKLRIMFGKDRADRVLKVLENERTFEASKNWIAGNSATETTKRFADFLENIRQPTPTGIDRSSSAFGTGLDVTKKIAKYLMGANGEAKSKEVAAALSQLSIADQARVRSILAALLTRGQRKQTAQSVLSAAGAAGGAASVPSQELIRILMQD
jgi:hypothetical protein